MLRSASRPRGLHSYGSVTDEGLKHFGSWASICHGLLFSSCVGLPLLDTRTGLSDPGPALALHAPHGPHSRTPIQSQDDAPLSEKKSNERETVSKMDSAAAPGEEVPTPAPVASQSSLPESTPLHSFLSYVKDAVALLGSMFAHHLFLATLIAVQLAAVQFIDIPSALYLIFTIVFWVSPSTRLRFWPVFAITVTLNIIALFFLAILPVHLPRHVLELVGLSTDSRQHLAYDLRVCEQWCTFTNVSLSVNYKQSMDGWRLILLVIFL